MNEETSKRQNVETSKPIDICKAGSSQLPERTPTIDLVWQALATVTDPEIPVISVVEMGIIADVRVAQNEVAIDVTPTFVACPAMAVIGEEIQKAVASATGLATKVHVVFDPPWSSDRINEAGRAKLEAFGLSPPRSDRATIVPLGVTGLKHQVRRPSDRPPDNDRADSAPRSPWAESGGLVEDPACPFCGSRETTLDSPFGPTLCRSLHYCRSCRQSFEHFKPV